MARGCTKIRILCRNPKIKKKHLGGLTQTHPRPNGKCNIPFPYLTHRPLWFVRDIWRYTNVFWLIDWLIDRSVWNFQPQAYRSLNTPVSQSTKWTTGPRLSVIVPAAHSLGRSRRAITLDQADQPERGKKPGVLGGQAAGQPTTGTVRRLDDRTSCDVMRASLSTGNENSTTAIRVQSA